MVGQYCDGVGVPLISLTVPHHFTGTQWFALFWSLAPIAFLAVMILALLLTQRVSLLVFLGFGTIMIIINELAIRYIHKEHRPSSSCLDSYGFPSGHAMIAAFYLTWLTIETIIHPGWNARKKITVIVLLWVMLAPTIPFRHPGGDHTWRQIAGGFVIGVIMALISFVLTQFVIVRYLEYIMSSGFARFFHLQNDLRPNYEHSANKGGRAPQYAYVPLPGEPKITNPSVFNVAHLVPILLTLALGIIGIVVGAVKHHQYNCDRASGPTTIGVGVWTLVAALFMLAVFINAMRRQNGSTWYPEEMQGLLWIAGFFIWMAFFWNVAAIKTSREDNNCPSGRADMTFAYAIVWFVIEAIMLVFGVEMYILLGIRNIYGFPEGVSKGRGTVDDRNRVPMEERAHAPLSPKVAKTKNMPTIQKTKSGSIIRSRSRNSNT